MAYTKTTWHDDVTPLSAANMNNIEEGINTSIPYRGANVYSDLNDVDVSGIYKYTTTPTNAPAAGTYGEVITFVADNYRAQICFPTMTGDMYVRTCVTASGNPVWRPWRKVTTA